MGCPQRFVLFTLGTVDDKNELLGELRDDYLAFVDVCRSPVAGVSAYSKRLARSCFMMPVVRSMVARALKSEWRFVPELEVYAKMLYEGIGNSGVIEDCAQRIRTNEPKNGVMNLCHAYCVPVLSELVELHKHQGPGDCSLEHLPKNVSKKQLPDGAYRAKRRNCTLTDCTDIVSTKSPSWATIAPESMPALSLDNIVWRHLSATQDWDCMKLLWKGCLLGTGTVVELEDKDVWGLSLGRIPQSDAIAVWPLRKLVPLSGDESVRVFVFDTVQSPQDIRWVVVSDWSNFEVFDTRWVGPRQCVRLTGDGFIALVSDKEPVPLPTYAAHKCFLDLATKNKKIHNPSTNTSNKSPRVASKSPPNQWMPKKNNHSRNALNKKIMGV